MEKKNSCARAGFSTILWGVVAVLLCAVPCVWAVIPYSDGGEHDITTDPGDSLEVSNATTVNISATVTGSVSVSGTDSTVNLKPNADLTDTLYAGTDSIVNIYAGNVGGLGVSVSPDATVTVYGTSFAISTVTGSATFDNPDNPTKIIPDTVQGWWGTLTGKYEDESDINLVFMSDVPIYLAAPGGGVTQVAIDIKPGSDPNPINPGSNGLVPVAILTTDDFNAADVDPATVTLAGAEVAVRGKAEKLMARLEDIDGDGDNDLLLQVETQSEGALWESGPVTLEGKTYDGQDIEGTDEVIIVPTAE